MLSFLKNSLTSSSSANGKRESVLVVMDLDNTLVDTEGLLKEKGLIPSSKSLYENDINNVVDAYIKVGDGLLEAPTIPHTVRFAQQMRRVGNDVVVITSRLSIPASLTLRQVNKVLGNGYDVFISDKKRATVNSLVRSKNYKMVIIVDDKFEGYAGLKVSSVVYVTPKMVEEYL